MIQRSRRHLQSAGGSNRKVTLPLMLWLPRVNDDVTMGVGATCCLCYVAEDPRLENGERSGAGPKQRCSVEVLLVMSGRIVAPRIASRSLLWSGRSSTRALISKTALAAAGGVVSSSGGCWRTTTSTITSPAPSLHGRFFSEQAYTPGIGVGKTSTGYVRALRGIMRTSCH
jgi:hypothetical protein